MAGDRRREHPYGELVATALRIAQADVASDLRERGGNNAGRDVDWIRQQDGTGRWAGGTGAWCASYVSSVWMRAAAVSRTTLPFRPSRGARALWRNVGRSGAFVDDPSPGCVALWRRGRGWQGHVGLVTRVTLHPSGLYFSTVEGNHGRYPAGVEAHGPYSLRAEREDRLVGFAALAG